ncbi:MAG: undecaprenyldiphospho-muramoylpentapeptide beta-N-acetylglucosaminyltransferase [Anaerolineaceae bacterium]
MRLLICAGGTGGGVYPALAVLQALGDKGHSILWVGSETGMENELIARENVPFLSISAAGLHGVGLFKAPRNAWQLFNGTIRSHRIIRDFKPDVMFFTGGYVAVPMALAGRNIPSLLFVPDIEPGLALKFLSRFSSLLALTTEASRKYFPAHIQTEVTGYPIRPEMKVLEKKAARKSFGILDDKPVLFVLGGSKGSRSINQAVWKSLSALLALAEIIHITGSLDWPRVEEIKANLLDELASKYHPFPYLHEEIAAAFSAADLVVCRAGASTLGELPFFGLPAILVPYPHAWRYQKVNADFLAGHGAARVIRDEDLVEIILPMVQGLLNDPEKLAGMGVAAANLAAPKAAENLANLLIHLAASSEQKSEVTSC